MIRRHRALQRKAAILTMVVALQSVATLFFILDLAGDIADAGLGSHLVVEGCAVLALIAGVGVGAFQIRAMVLAARHDETAVAVASGAAVDLVRLRFTQWKLTPAEADVALFALKGCDVAEIAALRTSAPGTVRAQLTRIYAKAGVGSQSALLGAFLEDLIDPLVRDRNDTETCP